MLKVIRKRTINNFGTKHVYDVVNSHGEKVGHITEPSMSSGFFPVLYRKFRLVQLLSKPTLEEALEAMK